MLKKVLLIFFLIATFSYSASISIIADLGNKDNLYHQSDKCKIFTDSNGKPKPVDSDYKTSEDLVIKGINAIGDRCVKDLLPYYPSIILYSDNNIKMNRGWYFSSEFSNMFNLLILLNSDKFSGDNRSKYQFLIQLLNIYSDRSFMLPWTHESHKKRTKYESNLLALREYINSSINNKKVKDVLNRKIDEIKSYIEFADTVYVELTQAQYNSYKGVLYKAYDINLLTDNNYKIQDGKLYKYDPDYSNNSFILDMCEDIKNGTNDCYLCQLFDMYESYDVWGNSPCYTLVGIDEYKEKAVSDFNKISDDFSVAIGQVFKEENLDILYKANNRLDRINIIATQTFASPNLVSLYTLDVNNDTKFKNFTEKSEAVTLFTQIKYIPKFGTWREYKANPIVEGFYKGQEQVTEEEQAQVAEETEEAISDTPSPNVGDYSPASGDALPGISTTPVTDTIENPIKNALFIIINHKNMFDARIQDIWRYIVGVEPLKTYYQWDGFNSENDLYLFELDDNGNISRFISGFKMTNLDHDYFMKIVDPRLVGTDPDLMGNTNEEIDKAYKRAMQVVTMRRSDISFSESENSKKEMIIIDHLFTNYDKLDISKEELNDVFNNDSNSLYIGGDALIPFNIDLEMGQHYYKVVEQNSSMVPDMETVEYEVEVCEIVDNDNDGQPDPGTEEVCHIETRTQEVQKSDQNGNPLFKMEWTTIGESDPAPYKCTAQRKFDNSIGEMFVEHRYFPYVNGGVVSADEIVNVIYYDKVWDKEDIIDIDPFMMYVSSPYNPNNEENNPNYYDPLKDDWFICHYIDDNIESLNLTSYNNTYELNLASITSGNIIYRDISTLDTYLASCNINYLGEDMLSHCNNKNPLEYLIIPGLDNELTNIISRWWYIGNDNINDLGVTKIYYICDGEKYLEQCEGMYND